MDSNELGREVDRMRRLGIEEFVRLRPEVLVDIWKRFGSFQYDWMVTEVSAQRVPAGGPNPGEPLRFFARFACPGAFGVYILEQKLAHLQRAQWFPPTGMEGVLIQRLLLECRAQVVLLLPYIRAAWFPLMTFRYVDEMHVTHQGDQTVFVPDHHMKGEQSFVYPFGVCPLFSLIFQQRNVR